MHRCCLTLCLLAGATLTLGGCNMVRGIGMDIYEVASQSKAVLEDNFESSYKPASSPAPPPHAVSIAK